VVTCTEYNRRFLNKIAGNGTTPIYRVYHGIDLDLFTTPPADTRDANEPFQILTVARLTPKKGLTTVYRALKIMHQQGVRFRHTLIGDGDDRDATLKLIRDLGLESMTRWCGTLPHDQVINHFRASDLFMLGCEVAANGDRDGIPNVLVESMAMGVPVLATRTSAIPELVTNGQTGVLVPPGDPSALAAAAASLLADPDMRQRMVAAGREKVTREFHNKALVKDLATIYGRMIPAI
jgi:glycosyltransferase involved in cell wall biosynthesis